MGFKGEWNWLRGFIVELLEKSDVAKHSLFARYTKLQLYFHLMAVN